MPDGAQRLTGLTLANGWRVVSQMARPPGATGGTFSVGYIVEGADGRSAFLKALDMAQVKFEPDPARFLQAMLEAFNHERDTLAICKDKRLSRVAVALEEGKILVSGTINPVQYLIFEKAEGDLRAPAAVARMVELAWKLRALHHTAVGLHQLHRNGIAHLDLKPSNVLMFDGQGAKIADLGRADIRNKSGPISNLPLAGDCTYAPPELLYNEVHPDWDRRRRGCDLYLFGSMVTFMFTGISMNAAIDLKLPQSHHWRTWTTGYRSALPYVRDAFGRAMSEIIPAIPPSVSCEIEAAIRQLCDPDPTLRGHPNNRGDFSLERYVSLFERLASRAEFGLLK